MKLFIKNLTSFLLILMLFPLIVTVCIQGRQVVQGQKPVQNEMEFYMPSILAGTMEKDAPREALKAQAVLLRTMLVSSGEKNPVKAIEKLSLKTKEEWSASMEAAVKETTGEILYYKNEPVKPAFHALSAGRTRDTAFPYLASADSRWDKKSAQFYSRVRVPEPGRELVILERDSSGYALKVKYGRETLTGEDFRERLNLNSANFSIETNGKTRTLLVRGIGHGIGMSLYGATCMAQEGKTYDKILKYYFKNIEIKDYYE